MPKNPVRNYAIEYVGGKTTDVEGVVAAAIAAAAEEAPTGDVFGDVSGALLGPLQVQGLLGSPLDGPFADGEFPAYDEASDSWIPTSMVSVAAGGFVPTYLAPDELFVIPDNRQALFALPIVLDAGAGISIGSNAALVEV